MQSEASQRIEANPVQSISNAVLYEGFMLYPYRHSSLKNQRRWNFGVLFPPEYCVKTDNSESSMMQTECVFEGAKSSKVSVRLRFLQICGETTVEREFQSNLLAVTEISDGGESFPVLFPGLIGSLAISCTSLDERNYKLTVRVGNATRFAGEDRNEALSAAFVSIHILLKLDGGAFHSMIEGPREILARADCKNLGAWPVLAGREGERDQMLAAPIILYDYPRISPQSPGDAFDGTEIDEILSLRLRTLSDIEKCEIQSDKRTAALLERAEQLDATQFANLHGTAYRGERPKISLKAGDRVILNPKNKADIFDLALVGRSATVASLETDFENNVYVCVTVDDDPGKDLGLEGKPGHRFFFQLDEVELL